MKILLTGYRGFIGSHLSSYLRKHGEEVVNFEGDITNPITFSYYNFDEFDAVINLTAYGNDSSHDQSSVEGINKTIETNLIAVSNLIQSVIDSKCRIFINAGSSSEYGTHEEPLSTLTPLSGLTPYARTKSAISTLLSGLKVEGKQFKTLRLFSVYGENEKQNRFIPTIFRTILHGETIPVSPGVHDFIYIEDVCRAFYQALLVPNKYPDVFHVASGKQYSNQEVIDMVEKVTGKKVNTYPHETMRSFDTTKSWVSDKKDILVPPEYSLEEGLKKVWEHHLHLQQMI